MKQTQNHVIDILFTLALFCVFAASSLMVVIIGANVYNNTVKVMASHFDTRTSITYVSTIIRQHDAQGTVYVDEIEGVSALVLEQELAGEVYRTWLYHHDGMLKEVFVASDYEVRLTDGQDIMEVASFSFEEFEGNLFRLTSVDEEGKVTRLLIGTRCR